MNEIWDEDLIGRPIAEVEAELRQAKYRFRIMERDGKLSIGTTDRDVARLNLAVAGGRVIRIWRG